MHLEKIESHTKITISGENFAQTQSFIIQFSLKPPFLNMHKITHISIHIAPVPLSTTKQDLHKT